MFIVYIFNYQFLERKKQQFSDACTDADSFVFMHQNSVNSNSEMDMDTVYQYEYISWTTNEVEEQVFGQVIPSQQTQNFTYEHTDNVVVPQE